MLKIFNFSETLKENIELAIEKWKVTIDNRLIAFLMQDSSFILTHTQDENDTFLTCGNLSKYFHNPDLAEEFKKNRKKNYRKKV